MSSNTEKERVKRIKFIEYLLKITQVNRKVVRCISKDYKEENILWFSDIEEASNCTLTDCSSANGEVLKIRHKAEPLRPTVPIECSEWADCVFKENEFGEIRKKLVDNPKVKLIFDKYEERWKTWKNEYDI
jgi:hypothetical protein